MRRKRDTDYWDEMFRESLPLNRQDFWRVHLLGVLKDKLKSCGFMEPTGTLLKTDLYEEATSRYNLFNLLKDCCSEFYAMDLSNEVIRSAGERVFSKKDKRSTLVATNVCNLGFDPKKFDKIISNSTLDHFDNKEDIKKSISEFYRVMKTGGALFITLDNPSNPVIFLRNILPYRFLKKLNLIPYPMGVTLSKEELVAVLEAAGFKVACEAFISHTPRLLVIWGGHYLSKMAGKKKIRFIRRFIHLLRFFKRMISWFERLERSIFARFTGYFVFVKAVK